MSGIGMVGIHKTGDYLNGMQAAIKDKLNAVKKDDTVSSAFGDDSAATLSISSSGVAQAEHAEREALIKQSIVQLEGGYKRYNLTDEETCILKSFRLEEYMEIRDRMRKDDSGAYQDFLKAEVVAKKDSDPSTQFKLYAKAYDWAYGDVFDRIHKENPDVDIYVKSAGTPDNHNYQMKNNRKALVISTDEIELLQSKKDNDKETQAKLWNSILNRIE